MRSRLIGPHFRFNGTNQLPAVRGKIAEHAPVDPDRVAEGFVVDGFAGESTRSELHDHAMD
jgi:hypothetical protein